MIIFKKNKNVFSVIIIILLLVTEIYCQGFKFSGISSGKSKGKNKEKSNKEKSKQKVAVFNDTDPENPDNLDENEEELGEMINNVNILSNYQVDEEEEEISKKKIDPNTLLVKEPTLNFKTDIGQCICDVTYNKCDVNCCCDPDCTGEKKYYFMGECLPEGPEGKDRPMCSKLLKAVHNPNVIVTDQYSDSGSAVLCIVMDHNPDMGYYYDNPGRIEDKTVFINQFKRLLTTYSYSDRSVSLILPQNSYMVGKPVIIANETQNTYTRKRSDSKRDTILQSYTFTLPQNTVSGKCEPNAPILFLIDKETECTRKYSKSKKEFTIDYYKSNSIVFVRNPTTNNVTHPIFKEIKMDVPEVVEIEIDDDYKEYSSDSFNEHKQDYFDPFHPDYEDNGKNIDNTVEYDPFHPDSNDDNNNNGENDPFHPDNNDNDNNGEYDPFHPDNNDNDNDNNGEYDPFHPDSNNENNNNNNNDDDDNDNKIDEDFFNNPFEQNPVNDDDDANVNNYNGDDDDNEFFNPFPDGVPSFYNPFEDNTDENINGNNNENINENINGNNNENINENMNENINKNIDNTNPDDQLSNPNAINNKNDEVDINNNNYINPDIYNIFNEPEKDFDDDDNMIPYVHNEFSDDKTSVFDSENQNQNQMDNGDEMKNEIKSSNMEADEDVKLGINLENNDININDDDEKEEQSAVINISQDKQKKVNSSDDPKSKPSKIHGIKINKNNIFKREDNREYVYSNGKYYIKKNGEDEIYKRALLQDLTNNNNRIKKRVIEKKVKNKDKNKNNKDKNVKNDKKSTSEKGNERKLDKVVLQVNYKIYYTIPVGNNVSNTDIIDFVDVEILYDERNYNENDLVTQKFTVSFLRSVIKEQENNPDINESQKKKIKPRKTSGNPGYIFGKEILTSNLVNGTLEETDGFTVPKNILINGKLRCPLTDNTNSKGRIPVTFGDDMVSECTLPIDPSINSDYAEISKKILEIHKVSLNNISYIARFGNTTVDNTWEWVKMIQPESVSTLSSCDTLPTELAFQFIWADVGALNNPQPMIIGARATYGTSGNVCTCTMGNYDENDCDINRKKLSYNIRTTVSFLRLPDHGTELYEPRAPRLIPAVDEDLFYPFFIRNDGYRRISSTFFSKKWFLLIIFIIWIFN